MSKWPMVTLGEIATIVGGSTPASGESTYWDGDIPWITPAEMGNLESPYVSATRRTLTQSGLASCSARLLPAGSVILSSRAPIGHLVINEIPMATNQGCKGLVPGPNVLSTYLRYALLASVEALNDLGTGATFKEVSGAKVKEFRIPLAPLDEQKRIVAKLDEVHGESVALAGNLSKVMSEVDSLWLAAVDEALEVNSPVEQLASLCSVFSDGDWIESKDQASSGFRLVQTGNVGSGSYRRNESRARFVSPETVARLKCTEVVPGDVLVSRLPDPVGRACVVPDIGERMITAVDCSIIRPDASLLPEYLVYFTQSSLYKLQIIDRITGTTRDRISRKNLGEVLVPVPSVDEQWQSVQRLRDMRASLDSIVSNTKLRIDGSERLLRVLSGHFLTSAA